jgi:hypothetical protein
MDAYLYKNESQSLFKPAKHPFATEIRSSRGSTLLSADSARELGKKLRTYLAEARRDATGEDIFVHFSAPSDIRWRPGASQPEMGGAPFLAEDKNAFYAAFFAHPA